MINDNVNKLSAIAAAFASISIKEDNAPKRPLVIYHGNCADGFSAAWCFYDYFRKLNNPMDYEDIDIECDFHAGVYSEAPPDCTDRIVYLVDFSYKRAVVKAMCEVAELVILIDHHKTAIDDLGWLVDEGSTEFQSNFRWYVDIERSGAMLAWDFLYNIVEGSFIPMYTIEKDNPAYISPPLLLNHIQDRDLWKFKLPNTREINANVFSFEYTFENWDKLMNAGQSELLQMTVAGAAIERKHHKDIAELVKACIRYMDFEEAGYYGMPVASLPYTLSSDAGRVLIAEADKIGRLDGHLRSEVFAACYSDTENSRIFSLRSLPDGADVSEIAKIYGGGGHKNAAGFKVPRSHPLAMA